MVAVNCPSQIFGWSAYISHFIFLGEMILKLSISFSVRSVTRKSSVVTPDLIVTCIVFFGK